MIENKNRKLFVHCAANKRVSIFIAIYQLLFLSEKRLTVETNIAKIWQPNETWRCFLDQMLLDKTLRDEVAAR
jgi:hypothetical protein